MMDTFTLLAGSLTAILILYILWPKGRPKGFPPGPNGVPVFGNLFQLTVAHKQFAEMAKIYGSVVGVKFGSYWTVAINNAEDIREALNMPGFAGRHGYNPLMGENVSADTKGISMSLGQIWKDERRFCLKTLRDFGLGKRSIIEGVIQEEALDLLEELRKNKVGIPISTRGLFNGSVLNVIWAIVAGHRFPYGDPRLAELLEFVDEIARATLSGVNLLCFIFPAFVNFRSKFPWLFADPRMDRLKKNFFNFLRTTINEHRQHLDPENPRDFLDAYLIERGNSVSDDDDMQLIVTLFDLFGAGSETTSNSLTWALFLLALYPDVQDKMYAEIQSVVGSRVVSLEDRQNLAYTEAVMAEIMRVANITAAGVPHGTVEDVDFKGYRIPKGTLVFGNLYAVHTCKETWGDPENFRPERFLSPDKKSFVRHSNVIPFGVGKRQCVGESLARDELTIFLTNIVQQLKITMPADEPKHSMDGVLGLVLSPEPHKIILHNRNT